MSYLWDRGRYVEALQLFDRKPAAGLSALERATRGAILERLGRLDEARAEYATYMQEAAKISPWRFLDVSERYRIPGSTLQQNMRFRQDLDGLPQPQSGLPPPPSDITTGCSESPAQYCPNATVPRGQMAVFVVRTFTLPI